jgi:hypothetical protein
VEPVWRKVRQCIQRVRSRARRGIHAGQVKQTLAVLSTIHSNLHLSESKGAAHS